MPAESGSGMIRFRVPDVTSLKNGSASLSQCQAMSGLRFAVRVDRTLSATNEDRFGVFFVVLPPINETVDCFVEVSHRVTLVSADPARTLSRNYRFCTDLTSYHGFFDFCKWADLLEDQNRFLSSDKSALIVSEWGYTKHLLSRFDQKRGLSDSVLVVGERRFHVSKHVLAVHSPFFLTLFFGEFADTVKAEIVLEDVAEAAFLELLRSIYYPQYQPTKENLVNVLLLADKFDVGGTRRRCEDMLIEMCTSEELLVFFGHAIKFRLPHLRQKCTNMMRESAPGFWDPSKIKDMEIFDNSTIGEVARIVATELYAKKRLVDQPGSYELAKANCPIT